MIAMKTSDAQSIRYIALLHTSNHPQPGVALANQRQYIDAYALHRNMTKVGEVINTYTASQSSPSSALSSLAGRKQSQNDFDAIIAADWSPLTKAGANHFYAQNFELEKLGVQLLDCSDDGPISSLRHAVRFQAQQMYSLVCSERSRAGRYCGIENGTMLHVSHMPFATDKLYSDAIGAPLYIVHRESDGSESLLHPLSRVVIRRVERKADTKWCGFRKHPGDRVTLVPGDSNDVAVVRRVFDAKFALGQSAGQIAKSFNAAGHRDMHGRIWNPNAIQRMLSQTAYIGIGVSVRRSESYYSAVQGDHRVLSPSAPRDQLILVDFPQLRGAFVAEALHGTIWNWQMRQWFRKTGSSLPYEKMLSLLNRNV